MAPEVVQALIKRVPPMKPAKLHGYTRHSVKGVVFPAIVPDAGDRSVVQGQVILELTDSEVDILDGGLTYLMVGASQSVPLRGWPGPCAGPMRSMRWVHGIVLEPCF